MTSEIADMNVVERLRFRIVKQFFPKPATYDQRAEGLSAFMDSVRDSSKREAIINERDARRLWAGAFRNNSKKECDECVQILRGQVELGLKMGGFNLATTLTRGLWYFGWVNEQDIGRLRSKFAENLRLFKKDDTVVVPNLIGGMPATASVVETLKNIDREPAAYALVGYSGSRSTEFEDNSNMEAKLYIPLRELQTLVKNAGKTVLVIDDTRCSGTSFTVIKEGLEKIGYKKFYELETCSGRLFDKDGIFKAGFFE